jgi:fatty acid desaturase
VAGWKHFAALLYSLVADVVGFLWMVDDFNDRRHDGLAAAVVRLTAAIFLAAHGRVVAAYLVHEAAHSSVFIEPKANRVLGIVCLWLAGCPYADFDYVRKLHIMHHKDRADVGEFDYRRFVHRYALLRSLILALEWAYVPAVDTIMHLRVALFPLFVAVDDKKGSAAASSDVFSDAGRCRTALVGAPVLLAFYAYLWHRGALLPHLVAGALVLHFLAIHDAFQHTYEVMLVEDYRPGPGDRTAQYEEENTFSNLISIRYPAVNLLSLNFGYHNAHHAKPMMPWYNLPDLHNQLYKGNYDNNINLRPDDATCTVTTTRSSSSDNATPPPPTMPCPQLLPFCELFTTWHRHRLRRVVEDDYGVVHPPGQPGRANDFVGSLGVSFLTV